MTGGRLRLGPRDAVVAGRGTSASSFAPPSSRDHGGTKLDSRLQESRNVLQNRLPCLHDTAAGGGGGVREGQRGHGQPRAQRQAGRFRGDAPGGAHGARRARVRAADAASRGARAPRRPCPARAAEPDLPRLRRGRRRRALAAWRDAGPLYAHGGRRHRGRLRRHAARAARVGDHLLRRRVPRGRRRPPPLPPAEREAGPRGADQRRVRGPRIPARLRRRRARDRAGARPPRVPRPRPDRARAGPCRPRALDPEARGLPPRPRRARARRAHAVLARRRAHGRDPAASPRGHRRRLRQRHPRARRNPAGAAGRARRARRPVRGRLRRLGPDDEHGPAAHDRPAADRGDGPGGGRPAAEPGRRDSGLERGAALRAGARRPWLHRRRGRDRRGSPRPPRRASASSRRLSSTCGR